MDAEQLESILNSDSFNTIDILNQLFPNEESLESLPQVAQQVNNQIEQIDTKIAENIKRSSYHENKKDLDSHIIDNVKKNVVEIRDTIIQLGSQAKETEQVIEDVCGSIKSFDNAKHNLTMSITILKRLQMSQNALRELELMVDQNEFGECADRLLALSSLLEYFLDFHDNDILNDIRSRFTNLRDVIKKKLAQEFNEKLLGERVDSSISPAFKAVDAIGSQYRDKVINDFVKKFLHSYSQTFKKSPLSEIDRRYNWLKQRIDYFNLDYAKVFPPEWRVPYYITKEFCTMTRKDINSLLKKKKPDLSEFRRGFERTSKFEKAIAESFKVEEITETGEHNMKPANEFNGYIGRVFSQHSDLYLEGESKYLKKLCQKAGEQIKNNVKDLIDNDNKLLRSGIELVQYMKMSIEKCSSFSDGQTIHGLFSALKDAIGFYASEIGKNMPALNEENGPVVVSVITNTTYYFFSIIDGLADRIKKAVPEDQRPGILVEDIKDTLSDEIGKQIKKTSKMLCNSTKPKLEILQKSEWQSCPVSSFTMPQDIIAILGKYIKIMRQWICDENFSSLRLIFAKEWVNSYYFDALISVSTKVKTLSNSGTERITLATEFIQSKLIELLIGVAEPTETKLKLHKTIILEEFKIVKNSLKILASPKEVMLPLYFSLFSNPTKDLFIKIVNKAGVDADAELNSQYDKFYNDWKKSKSK